ncbi:class I SAM-dependent methyltransferase [Parasphingopyxis lamellibrachiae]|uniref:Methyltransferase family protein n=1 Tax=Parasphingopyxis lamellibrachiae TaxID=680125 RepID=A0A3D9FG84_9SPHN|nr:class I SAM-dependent methyltransferase [Parasphingopyxis lamellibrachiae]RED16542.1 methyltransferase family protein [Parasphingopyxis lamellibrachiae]
MAGLWDKYVVPRLIGYCCTQPPIMKRRAKVVPRAQGKVLELGAGGGANFALYDSSRVTSVEGVDPSPELLSRAHEAAKTIGLPFSIERGIAEDLPFDDASFDTVLTTFTLCSVQDQAQALVEAKRVLKPGGQLLFCEHGAAPDAKVAKWQRRIEPVWKRIGGGCHLTRPVSTAVAQAGFRIVEQEKGYMEHSPRWAGWVEWGEARI